jgi:hypothetical protein
MSLFEDIVELGIPYASHYSDLHIPVTDETTELMKKHDYKYPRTFWSQIDNKQWHDIFGVYTPYWDKVQAICRRQG